MGAAVELRDHLMPLDSERGLELVTNLARYAEGLLDEAAVKKIYRFSDEDWDRLGSNDELVEKIQAEKTRRIRNGSSARERAQTLFAEAPAVLGTILHGVMMFRRAIRSKARASCVRLQPTDQKRRRELAS